MQEFKLKIHSIHEEIQGFKTLTFHPHQQLSYLAGQYLTFLAPTPSGNLRRSYSIISSPGLDQAITIGIRRIENGYFSRQLVDYAIPGDHLTTIGAGGRFLLPDHPELFPQVFFFAAGSGITPIYSLLRSLLYFHAEAKAVLIYSNPSPERTILHAPLQQLESEFPSRLIIHYLFSNNPDLKKARLNRELLPELMQAYAVSAPAENIYYICGPESYMRLCTYTLQEMGVAPRRIRREHFVIDRIAPARPAPPETTTREVRVRMDQQSFHFPVTPPQTILQAARTAGIDLPYSCELGRCGNCVARIKKGHVWLSYNEVLTEDELNKGLTLTCTGHPVDGDVDLEI